MLLATLGAMAMRTGAGFEAAVAGIVAVTRGDGVVVEATEGAFVDGAMIVAVVLLGEDGVGMARGTDGSVAGAALTGVVMFSVAGGRVSRTGVGVASASWVGTEPDCGSSWKMPAQAKAAPVSAIAVTPT